MTVNKNDEIKVRRGDVVIQSVTYSSLGPSHWPGIVFSVEPLVLFPSKGSASEAKMPRRDSNTTLTVIPQGPLTRAFNIVAGKLRMALSK
jgi:hypothetical protein